MSERTRDLTTPDSESLTHRTFTALQWRVLSSVTQAGLSLGVGVLLARLVPPKDFGLLAMAFIFTGLAGLFSTLGLGPTVIQRRSLTDRHIRVAFTFSVLLGASVSGLLVLLAPFSTVLLPNARLPSVLRVVALQFTIVGFGTVAGALLRRRLDFRSIFWIGTTSYVFGYALVATSLALMGFGVWSLVAGSLAQAFLQTPLVLVAARHPMRPLLRGREMRELAGTGLGFSLNGLVNYAARKGDYFVVGRWLGDGPLGLYTRAYQLMMLPHEHFGQVVRSVLFPAFAEIQEDRDRLGRAYLMSVQITTIVAAPVLAGMLVAAPHMVVGLYGARWAGAVAPLQILCLFGTFRALYPLSTALANATGRVYWVAGAAVVYALLVVGGGVIGSQWGISGVAWAVGIALVTMYLVVSAMALRILRLRWRPFLGAQLPGFLVAGAVAGIAFVARALLESYALRSIWIFGLLVATCAATMPIFLYFLPSRVRPTELYERFGKLSNRLPESFLRTVVQRFLRMEARP